MAVISINGVTKFYDKNLVLDSVSFDIEEGEIFGLLGSNGAGKSTLTKLILGIEEPSSGTIRTFGKPSIKDVKQRVALVPQDVSFYHDFTVEKNLRYFASLGNLKGKMLEARVQFILKWLNLTNFRNLKSKNLSGGYQRLLNIAISLLHDPDLIFMDEPTVGLDPKMRQIFWTKIKELKTAGKTVIITTHYMDEAESLCSRIALLKKGKLLVVGKPHDLIRTHGGVKVTILQIPEKIEDKDINTMRTVLRQPGVFAQGDRLFIPLEQEHSLAKLTAITQWLMKQGYNITSSEVREPNLEDVFMNMTGERMAEGGEA